MKNFNDDNNTEQSFEEIIETNSLLITKVCYYFSPDLSEFNDLRQDVLINIWRGWNKFRNEAKASSWIYRICFNTCISYQRKNKSKRNKIPISDIIDLPAIDEFELDKYNEMHRLINRLGTEDKALILMWLDEKSYDEISDLIGINRNTVATRLKRVKEKLVKMSNE